MSSEGDAADWINTRAIIEHDWQSTHAEHCVVDLHFGNGPVSVELAEVSESCIWGDLLCLRTGMTSFSRMVLRECELKHLRTTKFIFIMDLVKISPEKNK